MTLSARDPQRSFFDVSFLAENLFDERSSYALFRREILPTLEAQRAALGALYCADNGRPPIDPVLVLGVTLLQFMEKAPDRQALERLRWHLGWKHALGLTVDYAGFHPTTLVYFRQRLLEHQQHRVAFEALLQALEAQGLVPRRGPQKKRSVTPTSRQQSWVRGAPLTSAAGNPRRNLVGANPTPQRWPPAASESCVVTGNGGTKRRQRLLRPRASIPKVTHGGSPRPCRTRGQHEGAVTAWCPSPDRGSWPGHR
jgi:hypothetical protein